MPYAMKWAVKGRVLETKLEGALTLDELQVIRTKLIEEFLPDGKMPSIHSLFDLNNFSNFTFGIKEFMDYPQQGTLTPEQQQLMTGWRIYFGKDDATFKFVTSVFHQSKGHRVHWLPTRDGAIDFILARDVTLNKESFAEDEKV
jgi:hypothetical protein